MLEPMSPERLEGVIGFFIFYKISIFEDSKRNACLQNIR